MPRILGRRPKIPVDKRLDNSRQQVEYSVRYRTKLGISKKWVELTDAYRGRVMPEESFFRDTVVVNLMFATLNVIWPSISIKRPTISILPRQPEREDHAILVEQSMAYEWKQLGVQGEFREAVRDFLMLGMGWVKVGWEFEEAPRPYTDADKESEFIKRVVEANAAQIADPTSSQPTDEEIWAELSNGHKLEIVKDDPYVERISPFDMFVNSDATSLKDARWIAHRSIRTLEEAKADKSYNQRVRSMLTAESVLDNNQADEHMDRERYSDSVERVVIWEFWDLERREMMVYSKNSKEFLIKPRPFPYDMGHPFVLLRNYTVPGEFYAQGELEQLLPLVQELSETRTQMLNQRRKYNRKYLANPKYLDERGRAAAESDEDNEIIYVDPSFRGNLQSEVVVPVSQTPMSADLYAMADTVMGNMNVVSGLSEYQRGQAPETRQTATEAAMIQDATNGRQSEKLSQVEGFIEEIAEKLLGVMQQFMDQNRFVRVVGKSGEVIPFHLEPSDIEGKFMFEVEAGSTQPTNETTRRTNAITLGNSMAPFIEAQIVDPVAIAKHMLVEGFDVRQPEKFLTAPAVQQLAQAQALAARNPDAGQPGGGIAQDPNAQGPAGIGAPQTDPTELVRLQNSAQSINGIPDALSGQLAGQVGLDL